MHLGDSPHLPGQIRREAFQQHAKQTPPPCCQASYALQWRVSIELASCTARPLLLSSDNQAKPGTFSEGCACKHACGVGAGDAPSFIFQTHYAWSQLDRVLQQGPASVCIQVVTVICFWRSSTSHLCFPHAGTLVQGMNFSNRLTKAARSPSWLLSHVPPQPCRRHSSRLTWRRSTCQPSKGSPTSRLSAKSKRCCLQALLLRPKTGQASCGQIQQPMLRQTPPQVSALSAGPGTPHQLGQHGHAPSKRGGAPVWGILCVVKCTSHMHGMSCICVSVRCLPGYAVQGTG